MHTIEYVLYILEDLRNAQPKFPWMNFGTLDFCLRLLRIDAGSLALCLFSEPSILLRVGLFASHISFAEPILFEGLLIRYACRVGSISWVADTQAWHRHHFKNVRWQVGSYFARSALIINTWHVKVPLNMIRTRVAWKPHTWGALAGRRYTITNAPDARKLNNLEHVS